MGIPAAAKAPANPHDAAAAPRHAPGFIQSRPLRRPSIAAGYQQASAVNQRPSSRKLRLHGRPCSERCLSPTYRLG